MIRAVRLVISREFANVVEQRANPPRHGRMFVGDGLDERGVTDAFPARTDSIGRHVGCAEEHFSERALVAAKDLQYPVAIRTAIGQNVPDGLHRRHDVPVLAPVQRRQ
jgi:hypothetical protein